MPEPKTRNPFIAAVYRNGVQEAVNRIQDRSTNTVGQPQEDHHEDEIEENSRTEDSQVDAADPEPCSDL